MRTLSTCIFPAGGFGTRFLPVTKSIPKEMLPIINKPLIHYAVEEARAAGFGVMGIVHARYKNAILDYFDNHYELEERLSGTSKAQSLEKLNAMIEQVKFLYVRQHQALGLGHAIYTAKPIVNEGHPFGVVLADDLCLSSHDGAMAQLRKTYEQACAHHTKDVAVVAVQRVKDEDRGHYGIVEGQMDEAGRTCNAQRLIEKPKPEETTSNLAIIGRYILPYDVFDLIEKTPKGQGGEIQITDALDALAKEGRVIAHIFEGERYDCGQVPGYIQATTALYQAKQY